jgi:hypothetical protein
MTLRSLSTARMAGVVGWCVLQAGCSIISPVPLWELAKSAGAVASAAIPYGSSEASNTVYHLHPAVQNLCIEFNPESAVPDVVPALQLELRKHQIESRVYDTSPLTAGALLEQCRVWLKYRAYIAWDIPPMGDNYKSYVNTASLTLQTSTGVVLSSSNYELGTGFGVGKWASTQSKLAPVVTALITGFQN